MALEKASRANTYLFMPSTSEGNRFIERAKDERFSRGSLVVFNLIPFYPLPFLKKD